MTKTTNPDGSYVLKAGEGYDLTVTVDGIEQARTKEVTIPASGTLNEWVEVPEKLPEPEPVEETKEQKIEKLKAELAALETEA
jgi:hypothetical protein